MIRLELTMPPGVNGLFPTGKHGKRFRSPAYDRWLSGAEASLWMTKFLPIAGPVEVSIRYEEGGRERDLDGLAKAPIDFCVKHKLIEDDRRSIVRKITLAWDKNVKGCVVEIIEAKHA